jgi:hypothetical protein
VSYRDSAAHDRIAAERQMDLAGESGDPARIDAAQADLDEAAAAYDAACATDEWMRQAQAEAEAADRAAAIWDEPDPEPAEHEHARNPASWGQAQAYAWHGNPAAAAPMAQFEAEVAQPGAEPEPEAGL